MSYYKIQTFLYIVACVADAATANGPKSLPENPPKCPILCN